MSLSCHLNRLPFSYQWHAPRDFVSARYNGPGRGSAACTRNRRAAYAVPIAANSREETSVESGIVAVESTVD
jgi:hypothetical protein